MNQISSKIIFLIFGFSIILFIGCAFDLVHVKQIPTQLNLSQPGEKSWTLINEVKLICDTGYDRQLKSGTKWDYVGKVEQGYVYKTNDQILTVEGSNIFEAYIVILEDNIVGFYLPVEKSYTPIQSPQRA
ncbi:unnamed protein product, partial [marine sediment metagenome]